MRVFTRNHVVAAMALRLLMAGTLALGWVAAPWATKTAYACTCHSYTPAAHHVATADAIVIGTISVPPDYEARIPDRSRYFLPWDVAVDSYVKGTGPENLPIYNYALCDYPTEEGRQYLLFLKKFDGDYRTGLCMGNAEADTLSGQLWIQEVRVATWLNVLPGGTGLHRIALQVAAAGVVGLAGVAAWGWKRLTRRVG